MLDATTSLDDPTAADPDPLDTVLQRLYALGLTVQSVATSLAGDERGRRLSVAVEGIDATIAEVRAHMTHAPPTGGAAR